MSGAVSKVENLANTLQVCLGSSAKKYYFLLLPLVIWVVFLLNLLAALI